MAKPEARSEWVRLWLPFVKCAFNVKDCIKPSQLRGSRRALFLRFSAIFRVRCVLRARVRGLVVQTTGRKWFLLFEGKPSRRKDMTPRQRANFDAFAYMTARANGGGSFVFTPYLASDSIMFVSWNKNGSGLGTNHGYDVWYTYPSKCVDGRAPTAVKGRVLGPPGPIRHYLQKHRYRVA